MWLVSNREHGANENLVQFITRLRDAKWNNLAEAITIILVIEKEVKILQQDATTSWSTINHYWYRYNCTCLFYQLFIKQPSLHVCSQQEWFSRLLHILFKSQVFKLQIIHTLVIANTVLNFKFFKIWIYK